jgi:hypothetical protein
MKPETSLALRYQLTVFGIALIGATVQWFKADWPAALIVFFGLFVVLNLPLAYQWVKNTPSSPP